MIRSHTITWELAKIPGLVQFFDELDQNQNLRTLMARDPRRVLRQMQIAVPAEATITFHEFPKGWEISVEIVEASRVYINRYNTERGFLSTHRLHKRAAAA